MKQYRLKLKEEFINEKFNFDKIIDHNGVYSNNFEMWLGNSYSDRSPFTYYWSRTHAFKFYQYEIDSMPYVFIKMHDIIEVEEQLYYIKLPYINSEYNYLRETISNGDVSSFMLKEFSGFKMSFTKEEIEEKYPLYANDTCMIKVEDVNKI